MKLFAVISLALSVSAQNLQQDHRFGGSRGRNGNNGAGASSVAVVASSAAAAASGVAASGVAASGVAASSAASATAASSTSASSSASNSTDAQTSLTLDPNVIATGFENNGQNVTEAGQVPSLTSSNNFINFCLTAPNLPITNGKQITTGSCNPAPMGIIPSTDNMPSAKFQVPTNGQTLAANTNFTIVMAVANFETGNFVNAQENYFAAPQQVNAQGQIIGHSHVVVEQLSALDQTTPTNPKVFAFFKGLNAAAVNGVLTADVANGLPAGFYKVSSINTAANHQPVLVPIAQHGSLDDVVYFTVSDNNSTAAATAASAAGTAAAVSAQAPPAAASAAAGTAAAAASAAAASAPPAASAAAAAAPPAAASAAAASAAPAAAASAAPAAANTVAAGQAGQANNQNNNVANQRQQGGRRFRRDHPRSFA
jgi:hypothetical protein